MGDSGYNILITKLDDFIRKYYKNQMIRGSIYAVALILGTYLLVTFLEFFGRFNTTVRTTLFWFFILIAGFVLIRFFCLPLFKMMRFGKVISHSQAAQIIGTHFTNVQDKLLNTLQLHERAEAGGSDNSLVIASINQKASELRPVPFSSAIDLRENRKYLKWVLPPVAVILVLLFAAPSILTKPTERLLKHNQIIVEEAPFLIQILNDALQTPENTDFKLTLSVEGKEVPDKIYAVINNQQYLLQRESPILFNYTFKNIQKDTPFSLYASGFTFGEYELKVIPTPKLVDFEITLMYPAYIKRAGEQLKNNGDIVVPQGTQINWNFTTRNAERLNVIFDDSTYVLNGSDNRFSFSETAVSSKSYLLHTANQFMDSSDSIVYKIQVVPDLHPLIAVNEEKDSASFKLVYFTGDIKDDYGFRRLTFNYQFTERAGSPSDAPYTTIEIPVNKELLSEAFFYSWDLSELGIMPGDKLNYYFEVWDNDGFNGSKSARSGLREFAAPTEKQLEEKIEQKNEDIKDKLEVSIKEAKELDKKLEELQRQLMEKKEMSWQDKKKLEDLMKRQEELKKQVEELQQQNKEKNAQESEFKQPNEQLLEKQKQLEDLMQQVMTPELEKLMQEMQKLMEQLNKDEIQKQLDKMNLTNEDMEKELDRALEQFKQLEFEQKAQENIDKLQKLAEKQEELSKQSENKDSKSEDIKKEQEKLNDEFEQLKEDVKEMEKLNEQLEEPNPMPDTENLEKEIDQEQQKSSDELSKNKKSSASKSQKNAGQKMKEMAQQMQMAMDGAEQEQQEEDMAALRALLENIITVSFDQEGLMGEFKQTSPNDPKFNKLGQTQRKLKDDAKMIEDSLFALSKRVPQISASVNREINQINENMRKALDNIPDRRVPEVTTSQQYVMTSLNNLALMLDEALKQMQNQAASKKPGKGNCEKPGGNGSKPKPSASEMKKMQDALSKQLEEMKKQGKNQGKGQTGQQMSQQLAEMAAKQAAIRKAVEDKAAELNQDGSGNGNELKEISKKMEELQRDIVNNQITEETLRKQQDIQIRLLKAEEAERTRDKDNERKSNEAKDIPAINSGKYADYLRKKQQETELLKTIPPNLKPYYKEKVNAYFNKSGLQP